MSGNSRGIKQLSSKAVAFAKRHRDAVLDVILFGSVARGKETPGDIDILVIFKEGIDLGLLQELRHALGDQNVQVTGKSWAQLFDASFNAREAVLSEGYSLLRNTGIAEGLGYDAHVIFKYDLTGLSKSQRMRFYYSLHGRNSTGILAELVASRFSDNALLCPVESVDRMREYLASWKLAVVELPVLIPSRLARILRQKPREP